MKLFDLDWREVFARLPAWEGVPAAARRAWLAVKPSETVSAGGFGKHEAALVAAGLAAPVGDGRRIAIPPPARPLLRVLRAMDRHPVFDGPVDERALASYLVEHFTNEEQGAFGGAVADRFGSAMAAARRIGRQAWLDDFLGAPDPVRWGRQRSPSRTAPSSDLSKRLAVPAVAATARNLVRLLADAEGPMPARELPERLGATADQLAPALLAALRFALVFAGMRRDDLEPRFGIWPEIHARAHLPKAVPPKPVEPEEVFPEAPGLADLSAVLAALAATPARLRRNDGSLYVKDRRDLEGRLQPGPAVAEAKVGLTPEVRVRLAIQDLLELGFAAHGGLYDRVQATRAGLKWLQRSDPERLRHLLDLLRRDREQGGPSHRRTGGFSFWPRHLDFLRDEDHAPLVAPLTRAFLAAGEGVFVSTSTFLTYHCREANPLPAVFDARPRHYYWSLPPNEQALERAWLDLLRFFLMERLVAFGGARLGHSREHGFCFALTSAGRYLLGAADEFTWSAPAIAADVVVQPDFEIVFLGPSPAAEAVAGRFAERVAAGAERIGALYRLTRQAAFEAAATGATAEQALEALAGLSSKPLPANVERQLRDWFGATRQVRAQRTLLLRCPDPETAARVRAALGRKAELVGDHAVAAPGERLTAAVRNKLRKAGIFVEEPRKPEDDAWRDEMDGVDDLDDLDDLDDDLAY